MGSYVMNKIYILLHQHSPASDVPWVVAVEEHAAATPVILSFFETQEEAFAEIRRLNTGVANAK